MNKLYNWLCKVFGHKFDPIDRLIFDIENHAINRAQFGLPTIKCRRCGGTFRFPSLEEKD